MSPVEKPVEVENQKYPNEDLWERNLKTLPSKMVNNH